MIILFRFKNEKFNLKTVSTTGIDHIIQFVQLSDGAKIQLLLLDTAGQERYKSINETYYKKADCCLLMYDITSRESFDVVKNFYVPKINEYKNQILKVVLLGNKADLKDQRQVEDIEGSDLALENGYVFMESSCKDNYNVSDAFTTLVEMTNIELKKNNRLNSFVLEKKEHNKNVSSEKKCC